MDIVRVPYLHTLHHLKLQLDTTLAFSLNKSQEMQQVNPLNLVLMTEPFSLLQ